ncbi:MAG TPA: RNA 2',3'-cyclic phosphodiesterase [Opitutaceae bacterium]|nr:RNA 2',3'-cyclic phosphodiesterase [Opitutaceae bacterium]
MRSSASSNAPDSAAAPAALRLFIAIDAPAPVATALGALMRPASGFAWTPPERLHLTLRFLGDTPAEKLEPLRERLRAIHVVRFLLPVEGLGVFPPRGQPRVLWCGVGGGHPHLQQLRQRIDDSVLATGLDADLRNFVPHFTLAHLGVVPPARVAQWLREHRDFAAPPFRVGQFTLYSSELRPSGAVHTALETFPLVER